MQCLVIKQEQAQYDGEEVDPVMIAGQHDQQLPKDGDPGGGKAPASWQKHHEGHYQFYKQGGAGAETQQPFRELMHIPGNRVWQRLYFEIGIERSQA